MSNAPSETARSDGPTNSRVFDAIVTGSGLGGLTAAALYAREGRRVLVPLAVAAWGKPRQEAATMPFVYPEREHREIVSHETRDNCGFPALSASVVRPSAVQPDDS
jgi:flavin-dependent dehydrogenase